MEVFKLGPSGPTLLWDMTDGADVMADQPFETLVSGFASLNGLLYFGAETNAPYPNNGIPGSQASNNQQLYSFNPATPAVAPVRISTYPTCSSPGNNALSGWVGGSTTNVPVTGVKSLYVHSGVLYFVGFGGNCYGVEVFKLGPSGPTLLWDLTNGADVIADQPFDTLVSGFASLNGLLYFGAEKDVPYNALHGSQASFNFQLYSFDPATPAVAPVRISTDPTCSSPGNSALSGWVGGSTTNVPVRNVKSLFVHSGVLYFVGFGGNCYGMEVFKLGPSGPTLLWDMTDGADVMADQPFETLVSGFASLNGLLYFGAETNAPYPNNGIPGSQASNNQQLYSFNPATPAVAPVRISTYPTCSSPGNNALSGWVGGSTTNVPVTGVKSLYVHSGVLYFVGFGGNCYGVEVFKLGPSGPTLLWDLTNGADVIADQPFDTLVSSFASLNGLLYFGVDKDVPYNALHGSQASSNYQLYSFNPATPAAAPVQVSSFPTCSSPGNNALSGWVGGATTNVPLMNVRMLHIGAAA